MKQDFKVIFWGVRGSRAVPGPDTVLFGGNTPCIQMQVGGKNIIFDAGTGICPLGDQMIKQGLSEADIFITHTHWDHIQGFPFFAPAFIAGNCLRLYGQGKLEHGFVDLIRFQMENPFFPVPLNQMAAQIIFRELKNHERIELGDGVRVTCAPANHPNGCISFRVDYADRSCCYVTDTEHDPAAVDPHLEELVHNADIVIYDANFTDEEYYGLAGRQCRIGWGHSTWQEGIRLVKAAGAKTLVLFHHATYRTDDEMVAIEKQAMEVYPGCVAAREGMVLTL